MSTLTVENRKRIVAILCVITFAFVIILARIFWLQFIQGPSLQEKAMEQWVQNLTIDPQRGNITDRNGNVLAKTVNSDTVLLRLEEIKKADNAHEVADELSKILDMDRDEIYQKATMSGNELWLDRQVSSEQKEKIEKLKLTGVAFTDDSKRAYTYGDLLTQTLGITNVDGEGLSGIEAIYNTYLTGQKGEINAETDSAGRRLAYAQESITEPVDGYDVSLTIDYAIQSFLESSLEDAVTANEAKSASGIVMNPKTGEILAIATKPGYDLNNPPREDQDAFTELSRNKVITDSYELGSVLKTVTMSAVLEENIYDASKTFYCPGYKIVDGEKINCHADNPHGTQSMKQAMMSSCNPAFMEMGIDLGKDTYYKYLKKFGLMETTGINFPGEASSQIQDLANVNNRELARIAFGQAVAVSPLQLVTAVSSMVNGGELLEPYLIKEVKSQDGEIVEKGAKKVVGNPISKSTSEQMREMLRAVVGDGSGNRAYIPGYSVGGKTGTAQKYENGVIAEGKYITSFIGVAPTNDPELVCFIMIDEPQVGANLYGSVLAAPVVKLVLENSLKYLNIEPNLSQTEKDLKMVKVPDVVGMTSEQARAELQKFGLESQLVGSSGTIQRQFPVADSTVYQNTAVMIYPENTSGGEGTGRE